MCLGEHFSWERKSTEEFKILDSDDVIIWCFCGKRKIRFSHKNSKEYCVLWVNCAIKLLEERTAQRRWEKKSVQWWSRHVYYYYLRKFPDRNLSVCLNHKIHPYIYPPSPVLILKCSNDSEFQVTELRVPRVSTKAVTKFSQRDSQLIQEKFLGKVTTFNHRNKFGVFFMKMKWKQFKGCILQKTPQELHIRERCVFFNDECLAHLELRKTHYTPLMNQQ